METRENKEPITFTPADKGDIIVLHDDRMVISAIIAKHPIGIILMNSGNSINLFYWNCFEHMQIAHYQLKSLSSPLYSFTKETISMASSIQLPITLGFNPHSITRKANFMVVKAISTAYNVILGRPYSTTQGL